MYGPSSWLVTHLELQARSDAHKLFSGNLCPTQGHDTISTNSLTTPKRHKRQHGKSYARARGSPPVGGDESLQDASVWNMKRKLLTLGRDPAFHQAGQE